MLGIINTHTDRWRRGAWKKRPVIVWVGVQVVSKDVFRKGSFDAIFCGMADDEEPHEEPRAGLRMLSEVQELRALAHPLRIALLELLALKGALTATEASKVIGGTPANSAYHLRTLAKHGYVVEAEGGVGRERPWRLGTLGMSFSDDDSDPAVSNAARALEGVLSERWIGRAKYFRAHRNSYPAEVRRVSGESQFVLYATEAEVDAAQEEVMAALIRYQDRIGDPAKRPEGARAYEIIVSTHPFDLASFAGADGGDEDENGDEENNEENNENQ